MTYRFMFLRQTNKWMSIHNSKVIGNQFNSFFATNTTSIEKSIGSKFILSPSASFISVSQGLDGTVLFPGSGKSGRVTKGDVLKAIKSGSLPKLSSSVSSSTSSSSSSLTSSSSSPSSISSSSGDTSKTISNTVSSVDPSIPSTVETLFPDLADVENYTDVPNSSMRKIIARRLTESKVGVPHSYTTASIYLDAILQLRKVHNSQLTDTKISVNDYIVKAASLALRDVPEMNAQYSTATNTRAFQPSIDISIAVATPSGLITPIVFNCESLSLSQINATIKDLATRARDNKLLPQEYQGGTFTISNLGMFGIKEFSAVINPPQCAILAVGGGAPTIVPTEYQEGQEQQTLETKTEMRVQLSSDRRVVDENTAALFLQCLNHYMSYPHLMIL